MAHSLGSNFNPKIIEEKCDIVPELCCSGQRREGQFIEPFFHENERQIVHGPGIVFVDSNGFAIRIGGLLKSAQFMESAALQAIRYTEERIEREGFVNSNQRFFGPVRIKINAAQIKQTLYMIRIELERANKRCFGGLEIT